MDINLDEYHLARRVILAGFINKIASQQTRSTATNVSHCEELRRSTSKPVPRIGPSREIKVIKVYDVSLSRKIYKNSEKHLIGQETRYHFLFLDYYAHPRISGPIL